jgi:uncharacterized protein (DUF2147 family)
MQRLLFIAALLAVPAQAAPKAKPWEGIWRNARDTVRIQTRTCGRGLCGRVVRAAPEAVEAAARGGTDRLVGTELFRDLRREEDGLWYGEVYVPDLGRAVEGTIEQVGRDTLVAEGCLFAGFGCKEQRWTRVR